MHDELLAREDREEGMRVHLKAVDEPATLGGREGDEPDPVRTRIEPRGLDVDAYHVGGAELVGNRSQLVLGGYQRRRFPVIGQSFGYGNLGNRDNRSWSHAPFVGSHIVA